MTAGLFFLMATIYSIRMFRKYTRRDEKYLTSHLSLASPNSNGCNKDPEKGGGKKVNTRAGCVHISLLNTTPASVKETKII